MFLYYSWHLKSSNVTTIFHNLGHRTKKLFMVFSIFSYKKWSDKETYIRGISHDLKLVLCAWASGRRLLRHVVFPPLTECVLFWLFDLRTTEYCSDGRAVQHVQLNFALIISLLASNEEQAEDGCQQTQSVKISVPSLHVFHIYIHFKQPAKCLIITHDALPSKLKWC